MNKFYEREGKAPKKKWLRVLPGTRRVPGRTRDSWGNGAVLADKTRSLAGRAGRGLAYPRRICTIADGRGNLLIAQRRGFLRIRARTASWTRRDRMHFLHKVVAFAGCPPNWEVQKFRRRPYVAHSPAPRSRPVTHSVKVQSVSLTLTRSIGNRQAK